MTININILGVQYSNNQVLEFLNRRHPDYQENLQHWDFLKGTYDGGREWFNANIFKYLKEGDQEFKNRLHRAYRFNHTREIVDLLNKYVFKSEIIRNPDSPKYIKDFWNTTSLQNRDIDWFMRMVSRTSSIFGRVWIVVDTNKVTENVSVADQKNQNIRVYAYTVFPEDVLDLAYSEDGELEWILIREKYRDDVNPIISNGDIRTRYRLWTRNAWSLLEIHTNNKSKEHTVELIDEKAHDLGMVPVTYVDHNESEELYTSPSLIADIAYLDRAVANYLSNLDAIIQDQTFSQLIIPSASIGDSDTDIEVGKRIIEFSTKRAFLYDSDAKGEPKYISPDPTQAQVITDVINKIINEIYHSVGMAGERTKQDNAIGIDNSSGVAKAYDFERVNAMLVNKSKSLEYSENKILKIVAAWNNDKKYDTEIKKASYPTDFNIRNLYDEFDISKKLMDISGPDIVRRTQMKNLVDKLYPQLQKAIKDDIIKQIDIDWKPVVTTNLVFLDDLSEQNLSKTSQLNSTDVKLPLPGSENQQGQNNKKLD
jgi:hypothetical protein